MKSKKFLTDLRAMTIRDLNKKVVTLEEEYFRLRCDNKVGQLTDKAALKKVRRDIAKAKTIILQRGNEQLNEK